MSYYKESDASYSAVPLVNPNERHTGSSSYSVVSVEYVQKRKKTCGG